MEHKWALSVSQDNAAKEIWMKRMAESKFQHFEYSCGPFPARKLSEERIAALAPYIKDKSINFTSLHLPFYWDQERPTQPLDFERGVCAQRLANCIEFFSPLGMKQMTLHAGSPLEGVSRAEAIESVRDVVKYLVPYAQKVGANINVEVCPRGSTGGVPEEMLAIMDGMPDCVGICFDVNHANERYKEVPEWISILGKRINTFHISDCDEIDECHWVPGFGVLDWKEIMRAIKALDHECLLIYEVSREGFSAPAFQKREADPVWFIRHIEKNMEYLKSL